MRDGIIHYKWHQIIFAFILLLLLILPITAVGKMKKQDTMRIPLKEGIVNPTIQLDSMDIEFVDFYIQPRPWNSRSPNVWLKMRIVSQGDGYETFLNYYEKNDEQIQSNFPLAIGKYLLSLDVSKDSVDLLISPLKWGDTFVFDKKYKKGVTINGLTITYDFGVTANLIDEHGDFGGYEISESFKLSENKVEQVVDFNYISTREDNQTINIWNGYRIEILDNFNAPLKLRVTKE